MLRNVSTYEYKKDNYNNVIISFLDNKECDTNNGGCEQLCMDVIGASHYCDCYPGYTVSGSSCTGERRFRIKVI